MKWSLPGASFQFLASRKGSGAGGAFRVLDLIAVSISSFSSEMHKLFTEGPALYLLLYLRFLYQSALSIVEFDSVVSYRFIQENRNKTWHVWSPGLGKYSSHSIRFVYFLRFSFVFSRFAKPPVFQSHPQNWHYQFTCLQSFSHLLHLGNGSLSCCD